MPEEKKTVIIEEIMQKHYGSMENPDAAAKVKGPCGDEMEFFLKIKNGKIEEIKYRCSGCGYTSACGALAAFYADGRTVEEAMFVSPGLITGTLGHLPPEHTHCPVLASSAFYAALGEWLLETGRRKKGGPDEKNR